MKHIHEKRSLVPQFLPYAHLNAKYKEVLEAQLQQCCIEVVRCIPEPHLHQWFLLLLFRPDSGLSFTP
jgi:hypothetical protein